MPYLEASNPKSEETLLLNSILLQTYWGICSYKPHPTYAIEKLGLFDVVLAVVPLDDEACERGFVALAVLPGQIPRVCAILGRPLYPPFSEQNARSADSGWKERQHSIACGIYKSFRKYLVLHENWCSANESELADCVREWFLYQMDGSRVFFRDGHGSGSSQELSK